MKSPLLSPGLRDRQRAETREEILRSVGRQLEAGPLEDLSFSEIAKDAGVATLNVGLFINAVVKFVIIAFVLFLVVKAVNSMKKKQEAAPAAPPPPSEEVVLLTQIRDALRK